jgi:hypothetical protein
MAFGLKYHDKMIYADTLEGIVDRVGRIAVDLERARSGERAMNLHVETVELAKRFRAEADRLDSIFTQTADPRALQGGAICEDAAIHRDFSRKLFALAREMEAA